MNDRRKSHRGSLVGPVILISIGIILLLNNLGVLEWNVWEAIFSLWPILIVAAGLDLLIGRRSFLGSVIALIIVLGLLAGGIWLFYSDAWSAELLPSEEIKQSLDGAAEAQVILGPSVGSLQLAAMSDSSNLIQGTVQAGRHTGIVRDFVVDNDIARFRLHSEGAVTYPGFGMGTARTRPIWELRLNPDVPLDVQVDLGVGSNELDLSQINLTYLSADMGIGRTVIKLPESGRFEAKIDGGIGEITVLVPAGMEVRAVLSTGLAARQVSDDFQRQDDVYVSSGYAAAEHRADLQIDLAIGNVSLRYETGAASW
ncbi:MAG: cell wall-active antibiotics response protein [Chloroflexi bacterium]|nr:cell wall-active antibiotics response protein [Chloroflexota bacterium]